MLLSISSLLRSALARTRLSHFKIREFSRSADVSNSTEIVLHKTEKSVINIESDNKKPASVLEKCDEDISYVSTFLRPTFNFAAYINKSETLQELLRLGVNFSILEKSREVPSYILQLNNDDIRKYIDFFRELGIETYDIGKIITFNPFIFREDLDNLQIRINYLYQKNFSEESILRIITQNPNWLSFTTQEIDERLGFYQNTFKLSGSEVRAIAVRQPKSITYDLNHIKLIYFVFKEEMGFSQDQIKHIMIMQPRLFRKSQKNLLDTFEFAHKKMNFSLERMVNEPEIFTCRAIRLEKRHLFLKKLGRMQYDPKEPNYISIKSLITGSDSVFATDVAKSSAHAFNSFIKSL